MFSRPRLSPTRRARFRVPRDAPPGLYLVLIFDGDEGGSHNTWEYLHVIDADGPAPEPVVGAQAPRSRAPETDDAEDPAPDWLLIALAAAAGTGVGFLSATMRHRAAR